MKHILFVCTGNTCRSAMAKGIFDALVSRDNTLLNKFTSDSAGLAAYMGDPASLNSIKILKDEWDIDISSHRSKVLNDIHIKDADYVFTMTKDHKDAILLRFPYLHSKVFTLKEFISPWEKDKYTEDHNFALDIIDPYGKSANVYRVCALEIKSAIERLVAKLQKA